MAVKDIFTIKGLKTSVCNRAYFELYSPALRTAGCIKLLENEGAYILGTTKLASFAATEEPIECVGYQAPWNPVQLGINHQLGVVAVAEQQLLPMRGSMYRSALTASYAIHSLCFPS